MLDQTRAVAMILDPLESEPFCHSLATALYQTHVILNRKFAYALNNKINIFPQKTHNIQIAKEHKHFSTKSTLAKIHYSFETEKYPF